MPWEVYPHLTKGDWEKFVALKTTPEEILKRKKASESASKRKDPHHVGRSTYDNARPKWIKEGLYPQVVPPEASSSGNASNSTVTRLLADRVLDWWCSLHGRDSSGRRTISDPDLKKRADAVLGLKYKEASGEFTTKGPMDALATIAGKDHKGGVKGVGGVRVGIKKVFGEHAYSSTPNKESHVDKDVEKKLQELVDQRVQSQFKALLEHMGLSNVDALLNFQPPDKSSHHDAASDGTASLEPPIPDVKEETPCTLLLPKPGVEGGDLIEVAYGHVQPLKEGQVVHFLHVQGGHCSVSLDSIVFGNEDVQLPLPRPEWGVTTLADAQGSFVTWPRAWVCFSKQVLEKFKKAPCKKANVNKKGLEGKEKGAQSKEKPKDQSKPIDEGPKKKASSKGSNPQDNLLIDEDVLDSLTKECRWLHTCVKDEQDLRPLKVFLDKSQFHWFEDTSTWVTKVDVAEFLCGYMLNISLIHAFMSAMYEDLKVCDPVLKLGWLDPQEIRDSSCLGRQPDVKLYLEDSFRECEREKRKLILAPYLEGKHWMLLVLSPSTSTIYQFDSCRIEPPRKLLIVTLLNSVMKKIRASSLVGRNNNPRLISMKCAQQQNGVECGYYVMRYIHDVVSVCLKSDDLQKVINAATREGSFTVQEISEVRDKCAAFLTNYCL